jgi:hypothetical protein
VKQTVRWQGPVPALVLFALLTVGMTWPLVLHLGDHIPSDPGDPLYTVWLLGRNAQAVEDGSSFSQANIFYPQHDTAYYGDVLPVESALAWPIGRLSGNFVLAYNLLFLLSFFLCAAGMYALVRHLARSWTAALLSGVIFAFCVFRFAHLAHLELLFFAWIPLCFLYLHRFFDSLAWKDLLAAAFFYLLQVGSCAYYGEFLTVFVAVFFVFFMFHKRLYREPRFWLRAGIVALVCAAVLAWYFLPYVRLHRAMHFIRPLWEVGQFSAQLQHFLGVPEGNILWGWLLGRLGSPETQIYPGLVPIFLTLAWWITRPRPAADTPATKNGRRFFRLWDALNIVWLAAVLAIGLSGGFQFVMAGLKVSARHADKPFLLLLLSLALRFILDPALRRRWKNAWGALMPAERLYGLFLVLSWILCLGPVIKIFNHRIGPGLYGLLYNWLPGFKTLRVPARFAVLVMLALAVLSGWGLARLEARLSGRAWRAALTAGLLLLVLAESATWPLPLAPVRIGRNIPIAYSIVRDMPGGTVLIDLPLPASDAEEFHESLPMYYSLFHRKRIVNGYNGYAPPGYRIVREAMEDFPSAATFDLLRQLEVDVVLIHTRGYRDDRGKRALLNMSAFASEVELLARTAEGDHLYRIRPKAPAGKEARPDRLSSRGDPRRWTASANRNPQSVGLAFDGLRETAWTTGYPQFPGDFFEVDLAGELEVERLEMDLDGDPLDFPRGFVLEGSTDGRSWHRLSERRAYWPEISARTVEDFSSYKVVVSFERQGVSRLRITLTRGHPRHWTIRELRVLG